ncbi:SDR family NAD(P)-dependent oxidoreductase [Mycobacterium sp. AT1]|uniref:SDR family NAD(P)-dependent oxidoreductase n=1 Tax=Mycobacterium sp. AT1 TaxID=1961706 RepID=UPI0009AF22D9|nr:SDR family NAD(P)-dependent oxidoreductase [Mycobacterium sp. AT1]OPX11774.1 oxidoreductase [Mycobacterium sp. AT1]
MSSKLSGTVAMVTGASSGIGRAAALDLARHGASVAVVARREDRLDELVAEIEDGGGTALKIPADIAERVQADAAVAAAVAHFGRLDILVNNAGYMVLGSLAAADVEHWDRMIAVNQRGLLYMTKAALPHLHTAAADGLRNVADIVNISSLTGRVAYANQSVYTMTKFGVNGFSEALRKELADSHVRVGVLEPGVVTTELVSHNTDEVKKDIETFIGGIRPLDPDDIADGITFMVTRPWHAAVGELWINPTEAA